MAASTGMGLLEVLHDDVLLGICRCLPARPLLSTGGCCSELHRRCQDSGDLWRQLCDFLLGPTALLLHEESWSKGANDAGTAGFYRRLFRAAWDAKVFCYDHGVRRSLLDSLPAGQRGGQEPRQTTRDDLLCMSGHTSAALGTFILQVGGMRNFMGPDKCVHISVIDLARKRLFEPALASDSERPAQRMRHTTCVVTAPSLPPSIFPEAILMLGGHDGNIRSPTAGLPRRAVRSLSFLQITAKDGSEVRWVELPASGPAPMCIYHHACAPFAGGRRVCVFGGDIPARDPEFERIRDRQHTAFVYILDVERLAWDVVQTTGPGPAWRSFHAAAAHTSLLDGQDYFVIFGGTEEHCGPLSGPSSLADMTGYQLDLQTYTWCTGPTNGFMPTARMRFGAAIWGRHMLVHGGQCEGRDDSYIVRLNLSTLRWGRLNFTNEAPALPLNAFETGSPTAGCVVGGARPTRSGPMILTRLVVFRLHDPDSTLPEAEEAFGEEVRATSSASESSDEEDVTRQHVRVQIDGRPGGPPRTLTLPMAMFALLQQQAGDQENLTRLLNHLVEQQEAGRAAAAR